MFMPIVLFLQSIKDNGKISTYKYLIFDFFLSLKIVNL